MPADSKSILIVIFAALTLAATMMYSIRNPDTGDDIYETQTR
jgi:hypothetical protein